MNRRMLIAGAGGAVVLGGVAAATIAGMGSDADYAAGIAPLRAPLSAPAPLRELVRFATLAPNGHNTQPWRFRIGAGHIDVLPDPSRRTPVVDPDDHHVFVSLGAAAATLALAGAARGQPGEVRFDAANGGSLVYDFSAGPARPSPLFDAIVQRQSTRGDYDGRPVSAADLASLARAAAVPGVALVLVTDRPRLDQIRDLVIAGNSAQLADPAFRRELKSLLRFNPSTALRHGDGLFSAASGSPALPDWLGPLAFDWLAPASSQNDAYAKQIRSSAGIAIFTGAIEGPAGWVAVGAACQRFSLQATALGLKHAYLNQPVEVPALRPALAALVGMAGTRPDIVMRFGTGPALPFSPRRPVDAVIVA